MDYLALGVDSSISSKRVVINSNSESVNSASNGMCVVNVLNSVNATPTVRIVLNEEKQIWKPKGKLSDNSLNKTKQIWKQKGKLSDNSLYKTKRVWKATGKLFADIGYQWRPTGKKLTLGKLDCGSQWRPTGKKFALGEMCHLTKLSVKCRTGHALVSGLRLLKTYDGESFKAHEFCGKVHRHTCFVRDINGTDILKGSRGTNLYTISIDEMMKSSPICLLSKASKSKSWLWHRRLNHLNFGTINDLARKDLVRGLPRLKFEKDHLCSACQLGKSKKFSHRPKSENTNMEVLHTLHMDLCGPMRVQSIKGKKYILVIVDDYSRFTWVKFLRSKDETPEFVTNFLKQIQVGLNKIVRFIRTDNGTEFVNQVMSEYYEGVGIFHQTSVPRTPQQNGVVERRNRTLVEAARTMMIFSKKLPWFGTIVIWNVIQRNPTKLNYPPDHLQKNGPKIIPDNIVGNPHRPCGNIVPVSAHLCYVIALNGSTKRSFDEYGDVQKNKARISLQKDIGSEEEEVLSVNPKDLRPRKSYHSLSSEDVSIWLKQAPRAYIQAKPNKKHFELLNGLSELKEEPITWVFGNRKYNAMSQHLMQMRIMRDVKIQEEVRIGSAQFLGDRLVSWSSRSNEARQYQLQRLNTSPCLDCLC
ncbi:retrovirus-related pol polyprotein from transposon TNT 1-94 [Tanacetum coccineum]|uniref:Retrovirus-related pol polyprotein from transposon TNT 1-94 n=1 Tax=Tanacetum coccineum TaxID=301880 RepID=A0ABQ4Y5L4_9ASTR